MWRPIVFSLAGLCLAGSVSAGAIVQRVDSFSGFVDIDIPGTSTGAVSLSFDQFDASLGTLASVQFVAEVFSDFSYGIFDTCGEMVGCVVNETVTGMAEYTLAGMDLGQRTETGFLGCMAPFGQVCLQPNDAQITFFEDLNKLLLPDAAFIGSASIDFTVTASMAGPPVGEYDGSNIGVFDALLIYNFIEPVPAVPLPSGGVLLLGGLLVLAARGRRRVSRSRLISTFYGLP